MNRSALNVYVFFSPLLSGATNLLGSVHKKTGTFLAVRKHLFEDLEKRLTSLPVQKKSAYRLWVHAASVGEFEQARPVIAALQAKHAGLALFVSFLSDSGYNARKDFPGAAAVFYLPVDTPANARKLVSLIRPDLLMLMRYDFWPNHLIEAKKAGARLLLVAAVLRQRSQYFRPILKNFYRSVFNLFDRIYTVSENDTRAFENSFGCKQAETVGDPRFDQVLQRSLQIDKVAHLKPLYKNRTVLIAGSVWDRDEAILLSAWRKLKKKPVLILVPHKVDHENMERLCHGLEEMSIAFEKVSAIENPFDPEQQALVIDQTGYLAELYSLASIAYVGGGFGVNVHNTIEPAAYGVPVLFGPRHHNSPEAVDLVAAGGAMVITNEESLFATLKKLTENAHYRMLTGSAGAAFVMKRAGATERITADIENDYLSRTTLRT
ncbi:MAG: 3-deoxy-D-manno-octulosonic acid transferase [Chlorobiaceae bacterium]|jgi:3-deoxy-D-manno-octulosonic-acid transferase|nr:3-deoxy-D-manno-octulosonic acid transferase [Chlorobiaceae bacterium]